jgi:hypothetical protein
LIRGIIVAATICDVLIFGFKRVIVIENVMTVMEQSKMLIKNVYGLT